MKISRRDLLLGTGTALATTMLGGLSTAVSLAEAPATEKTRPRFAHLTDIHLKPELKAPQGFAACLHHVQSHADAPQWIVTGGDSVFDIVPRDQQAAQSLWDLWTSVLKEECSLPVESCLGNHDIWGWHKKSGTTGDEPLWGKKWACDVFQIERPYRSFTKNGWQFILLDSMIPHPKLVYEARLDDEQFEWLRHELATIPATTPIVIVSHIPILAACAVAGKAKIEKDRSRVLTQTRIHTDCNELIALFDEHKNVKLCLGGHLHLYDRVDYNGVTYMCGGAVCGEWWKGNHQYTEAGYNLIDLYDDGSFTNQYTSYGWFS